LESSKYESDSTFAARKNKVKNKPLITDSYTDEKKNVLANGMGGKWYTQVDENVFYLCFLSLAYSVLVTIISNILLLLCTLHSFFDKQ